MENRKLKIGVETGKWKVDVVGFLFSVYKLPLPLSTFRFILFFFTFHFSLFTSLSGLCQNSALYNKALELRNTGKFKEAASVFQTLLKSDSNNVNYLVYYTELSCKTVHDNETIDKNTALKTYRKGQYLAKKALKIDSNSAEAYNAYAFTIGILNEYASTKQQIANAGLMKKEIDKCLALNPHHAGAYHLLGRWYRRLAEFNSVEKLAVKVLYGATLPVATYEEAAKAFEKSVIYEPNYILHQYELAYTYHKMGRDADAKVWLLNVINSKYAGDDSALVKDKCRKLLKELK